MNITRQTIIKFFLPILFICVGIFSGCEQPNTVPLVYPENDSEQTQLYISKCGECHAAPLPSIHPAYMWPGIVDRMQMRMVNKAITPLSDQEVQWVVSYLQKHSPSETQ